MMSILMTFGISVSNKKVFKHKILENYQQKDGTVKVPAVLVPYMNGKKVLEENNKAKIK